MNNRRTIIFLLFAISVATLALAILARHSAFFRRASRESQVLLAHSPAAAERISVVSGDRRLELRKNADDAWTLYSPFPARVNPDSVYRLLDLLEQSPVIDSIPFSELPRRHVSLADFGLTNGTSELVLSGPDWCDRISFGRLAPSGREVYLRVNADPSVLAVRSAVAAALPESIDSIRDRQLLRQDRSFLRFIEIRRPNKPFIRLSRETGTWELLQPAPAPADDRKVESLVSLLYSASVNRFVWPSPDHLGDIDELNSSLKTKLALYGFESDTSIQVSLQDSEQSQPVKFTIGSHADSSDDYILLPGGTEVGTINPSLASALRCTPAYLRDDRLFFLKPSAVSRLEITCNESTLVLTQTQNIWSVRSPISGQADSKAVAAALDQLLRLRSKGELPPYASASEQSMLPPVSRIDLVTAAGTTRFTLTRLEEDSASFRLQFADSASGNRVAIEDLPPDFLTVPGLFKLCDTSILALPARAIRRLTFRRGPDNEWSLSRLTPDSPWLPGADRLQSFRLNAKALAAFLDTLGDLRADWIVNLSVKPEDLPGYGLKDPWLEIAIDLESTDAVRKTLAIGKEFGFGKRYAALRGRETVYVLDEATVKALSAELLSAEPRKGE